jgi:hypothetical protein
MMSDEAVAKLIDETLNFKKTAQNRNIKSSLLKLVPAAAAVALIIGFMNLFPHLADISGKMKPGTDTHGGAATQTDIVNLREPVDQSDLFLPEAIEKSFYEDKILAAITDQKGIDKLNNYYWLRDSVYKLDPDITVRERNLLLECLRDYTDLTAGDMYQMCANNGIPLPRNIDPAYANVRFGDDYNNTLLLDVEWHTYDTYMEEIVEPIRKWDADVVGFEKQANEIKNKIWYRARTINGKSAQTLNKLINDGSISIWNQPNPVDISKYLDSDGYYIYKVFPIMCIWVYYSGENNEFKSKAFAYGTDACGNSIWINSQSEYEYVLENKIIPFCDDLLAKGMISQKAYEEYTIPNLMDYYIDLYFN